jgi:DNA polymerase III sliding clamp (beta) subunit (PCNA family)
MLKALKFVKGAVATKGLIPALTHFELKEGFVVGYNGAITLASPFPLTVSIKPKAIPFIKAIEACKEVMAIHITKTGRLAIKSGKFKAFIESSEDAFPVNLPEGEILELSEPILPVIKKLAPFIAEDASRQWARGILFRGKSGYATNNICIVEHRLNQPFPVEVNIPHVAIKELLRINVEPASIQVSERAVTFHYPENRWLKSKLLVEAWPDIGKILDNPSNAQTIPKTFFDEVERLIPFLDELQHIYFTETGIATGLVEGVGATVDLEGLPKIGVYQAKQLLLLREVVNKIDFEAYPKPCLFYGDNLRGALIGMQG